MGHKKKRNRDSAQIPARPADAAAQIPVQSLSVPAWQRWLVLGFRISGVIAVIFLAFYFRTYQLREPSFLATKATWQEAEQRVFLTMQASLKRMIDLQYPDTPENDKRKLLGQKWKELINGDREGFQTTVNNVYQDMLRRRFPHFQRQYLLDPDSYYYYGLTENVAQTGRLGGEVKDGLFFNPLRHVPEGLWDWVTLHPYWGLAWSRLVNLFIPGMPFVETLAYYPLLVLVIIITLFFVLCRIMRCAFFPSLVGCLSFILSAIVIQRTAFGWYDTDVYHFVFFSLILASFFLSLRSPAKAWLWGVAGGFSAAFYALFWSGWLFVYGLMGLAAGAVSIFQFFTAERGRKWHAFHYVAAYGVSAIAFAALMLTPKGFYETVIESFAYGKMSGAENAGSWPNVFVWIGEDRPIPFRKLVFLSCNLWMAPLAVAGFAAPAVRFWKERKIKPAFYDWLALAVVTFVVGYLSLSAQRFTVFIAIPVSLFLVWGIEWAMRWIEWAGTRLFLRKIPGLAIRSVAVLIILVVALPETFILAHTRAMARIPIMNDAWYDVLNRLKTQTPPDSLVTTWWTAGHFVTSVARRSVSIDGMNMYFPDTYWVAKALLSDDEKEACGILRMLGTSGNQAAEFLTGKGIPVEKAVPMILRAVRLSRSQAQKALRDELSAADLEHLLWLTHSDGLPRPVYLLLYTNMIEHNVIIQSAGRWDFGKVKSAEAFVQSNRFDQMFSQTAGMYEKKYLAQMFYISGEPWKYEGKLPATRRQGPKLYFTNGLVIDLETKKAVFSEYMGRPVPASAVNLMFAENGKWVNSAAEGEASPFTAILFQDQGQYFVVTADEHLARSVLFRLSLLDGAGFSYLKPFASSRDPNTGDFVKAFEVDWAAMDRDEKSPAVPSAPASVSPSPADQGPGSKVPAA